MKNDQEHQVFTKAFPVPVHRTRIILDPATGEGPEVWTATFPASRIHHEIAVPFGALHQASDGLAHLAEHVVLNEDGPEGFRAQFAPLRSRGGWYNGHTKWLHTCYHVRIPKNESPVGFEILWNAIFLPKPDQDTLEKQRKVVMLEMLESWHSDQQRIRWMRRRFPSEPRLHQVGGGSQEALKAISLDDIRAWLQQTHRAQAAGFFAAGPLGHDAHIVLVRRRLEALAEGTAPMRHPEAYPLLDPRAFRLRVKSRAPMAVFNLTATPPEDRRENVALRAAISLLISPDFGTLYRRLRRDLGIVYGVDQKSHHRLFRSVEIGAACLPGDAPQLEEATWQTLEELGTSIPSEAWEHWIVGGNLDKTRPLPQEPWSVVDTSVHRWRKREYDDHPLYPVDFNLTPEDVSAVIRKVFAKPKVAIRRVVPKD